MEIDYDTLTDFAGADGYSSVPLIILDYLFSDEPWHKSRFIKDAVPTNRCVMVGIENPFSDPLIWHEKPADYYYKSEPSVLFKKNGTFLWTHGNSLSE